MYRSFVRDSMTVEKQASLLNCLSRLDRIFYKFAERSVR